MVENDFMENIYRTSPYGCDHEQKQALVIPRYNELARHHYNDCGAYHNIIDIYNGGIIQYKELSDIPFLPVRLFKEFDLYSVPKEEIKRTVMSSGTTGQISSRIHLDKTTAGWQQKVLVKIVGDFIGTKRMPMLIIDAPDVIKNRTKFSTRGAGILGFAAFGAKQEYALNEDMTLNKDAIQNFLTSHEGEKVFLFGFTFIIWKHFLLELEKQDGSFDFSNAVMIHGGGWKKLQSEAVSKEEFSRRFADICGLKDIHENYGMAEQTGSIFMECECGHLHASNFSEVITRDPITLKSKPIGEKGILQVMSVLPWSYPGFSLLTEDEAVVMGEDDCPCGRKGRYFKIIGRLKNAELRGCSDTYAVGSSQ